MDPAHTATLPDTATLYGVGDLMGEYAVTIGGSRPVLARAEVDVAAVGERLRVDLSCDSCRFGTGVHPDPAEIGPEALLERGARSFLEWLSA